MLIHLINHPIIKLVSQNH